MRAPLFLSKCLFVFALAIALMAPGTASAHENIGGDELAAANWMLLAAMAFALVGVVCGLWAWRTGQFKDVEESKYRMLDMADDYDVIMQEVELRERELSQVAQPAKDTQHIPAGAART